MNLNDPIFTDEAKARAYFESIRWPDGPVCPHCGEAEKVYRLEGKSHRPGLIHCNACSGSFTVTTGGVMESSHIPLTKWALAFRLYAASKKGFSANQLSRMLGITYKSAWFMAHRVREAMAPAADEGPIGGEGKIVESDETEISPSRKSRPRKRADNKKFVSLVERGGRVRSRKMTGKGEPIGTEVQRVIYDRVDATSNLHTDSAMHYRFAMPKGQHESVNHQKEYARTNKKGERVHVNTAEGYFSIFKRGLVGTYQHMSEQHLQRYLNEFDFRMTNRVALGVNDDVRTERAIKGAEGKRLRYQGTCAV
ncbi:MAG TPA: IS1595 family transposase [Rhizomicrobium sp.]|nr:IS1595 family transposase [Rhizomicrobium sp.]